MQRRFLDSANFIVCPICKADGRIYFSQTLNEYQCTNCGAYLWYVNVSDAVFVFNPATMDAEHWSSVCANVPTSEDDFITVAEKVMFLKEHCHRAN